jgi:hypothetical protein
MDFIPKSSRIVTAILLPHQACLRAPRKFFNPLEFLGLTDRFAQQKWDVKEDVNV